MLPIVLDELTRPFTTLGGSHDLTGTSDRCVSRQTGAARAERPPSTATHRDRTFVEVPHDVRFENVLADERELCDLVSQTLQIGEPLRHDGHVGDLHLGAALGRPRRVRRATRVDAGVDLARDVDRQPAGGAVVRPRVILARRHFGGAEKPDDVGGGARVDHADELRLLAGDDGGVGHELFEGGSGREGQPAGGRDGADGVDGATRVRAKITRRDGVHDQLVSTARLRHDLTGGATGTHRAKVTRE